MPHTTSNTLGVTLLICTYNGATRLPETLGHLAAQKVPADLPWEVLLVSNASTDDTLAAAERIWAELGNPVPLRTLEEPKPGKENALIRGFDESNYENICIVDDDNWLYPNYVGLVTDVMNANPQIGILGAFAEGAFEVAPPQWFEQFRAVYAIGPQNNNRGGALPPHDGYIYGAGSVVRRQAWQRLRRAGFEFITSAKRGLVLSGAEDIELGDAMRLAGYQLWYDGSIRLRHFMYKERLTWSYLMRMGRGTASSQLTSGVYYFIFRHPNLQEGTFRWLYMKRLVWLTLQLSKHPLRLITALRHPEQENPDNFETTRLWYNLCSSWSNREQAVEVFKQVNALKNRLRSTE